MTAFDSWPMNEVDGLSQVGPNADVVTSHGAFTTMTRLNRLWPDTPLGDRDQPPSRVCVRCWKSKFNKLRHEVKERRIMPYAVVSTLRIPEPGVFIQGFNSKLRSGLESNGATSISFRQFIMGGEMSGSVQLSMTFDEIDDAVAALGNAGPLIPGLIAETGTTVIGRSMAHTRSERGVTTGEYGSVLMTRAAPQDEATHQSNADLFWSKMSSGCNGQRFGLVIAGGERTGVLAALTWTDSLSALQSASDAMFASPDVQQVLVDQQVTMLSKGYFRTLES